MPKARIVILEVIMVIMLAAIAWKLFDLQIIKGDQYLEVATERLTTNVTEKAPRGEILDRYGVPLVTNKVGYSVVLQQAGQSDEELNAVIKRLIDVLYSEGCAYNDTLPITYEPYEFSFTDEDGDGSTENEKAAWFDNNEYTDDEITRDMSAADVVNAYKQIYEVSDIYDEADARRIVGIRYEAEERGFSQISPFVLADDVNVNVVAKIKEHSNDFKGVSISNTYMREYEKPGLATHILGRIGRISQEEYNELSDEGYGLNDTIGKQGIEKWGEQYLRGVDGTSGTVKRVGDDEVSVADGIDPIPGNSITLTIDSRLQEVAEQSLGTNIEAIRNSGGRADKDGGDCDAGAAVVIDIKTGDTLALASYPSYDMSRFDEDYQSLLENTAQPMWNRAVSGLYSPGSTFKPLVAIAAMESGNLSPNEIIVDEGIYTVYEDYQPTCWIWSESNMTQTHGPLDVSGAIENSCNYFFYEVGNRMGISVIDEYAAMFGLGEYTGIELGEESKGAAASPEYKKSIIKNVTSQDWYDGDTLQAAIGQSYSLFTPVQLANYAATIANGGTHYKVNLVKNIRSSVDGSLIKETVPEVRDSIELDADVITAVKNGMRRVVDEGSASAVFTDYAIPIGGKTGTAQVGEGSNNAVFIAYAPFDDPQIAVSVVLEHGVRGANAANVARDIFDCYFGNTGALAQVQATAQPEGTPQPTQEVQDSELLP